MIVAIDPGHIRTGIVLLEDSGDPIAYATFAADKTCWVDHERASDLATILVLWAAKEINKRDDTGEHIVLVIEKPIMGKNVLNFEKQMRLFTCIIMRFSLVVDKVYEVNPMALKKAATGNGAAKKIDIVNASPFDGPGDWGNGDEADKNQEAVADAWGAGVCYLKKMWDVEHTPHVSNISARGPIVERWLQ